MPTTTLPTGITAAFHQLHRRLVLARVVRAAAGLVALQILGYCLLLGLDALVGLCTVGLQWAFAVWALAGLVLTMGWVVVPLLQRPSPFALAALIEQHYPEMEERLTSAVALCAGHDFANGTEELILVLQQQAENQARQVDVRRVGTQDWLGRWLAGAVAVAALGLGIAWVADADHFFARRFFSAWFAPVVGYAALVMPGDGAVPLGSPVTITAQLVQEDRGATLPRACFLIYQMGEAQPQKMRMAVSGANEFRAAFERVSGDMRYHVEAGEFQSRAYQLAVFEPVEVIEEIVQVIPPPYVHAPVPGLLSRVKQPLMFRAEDEGFHAAPSAASSARVLQYSRLRTTWRFNRPPLRAEAHWLGLGVTQEESLPLHWSKDRLQAYVELPLGTVGAYFLRLTMTAEADYRTRHVAQRCTVFADEPPFFTDPVSGLPRRLSSDHSRVLAKAEDVVRLRAGIEDTVGLDMVYLEYRINQGPITQVPLAKGEGKLAIAGDFSFPLKGRVKDGDLVEMRLAARDTRRLVRGQAWNQTSIVLPPLDLSPQVTYDPPHKEGKDAWLAFKIAPGAEALPKQEITADREALNQGLAALIKKVEGEQALVKAVKLSGHAQSFLPAHGLEMLAKARQINRGVTEDLHKWAIQGAPFSADLAQLAQDLTREEIARTGQALVAAEEKKRDPEPRDQFLDQADRNLEQALKKLALLRDFNVRLAQDRLDQLDLQRLAELQAELARRAAELAKKDFAQDPKAKEELAQLQEEQQRVASELTKLSESSQLLKDAMHQEQKAQAMQLAQRARELAKAQQALNGDPKNKDKDLASEAGKLAGDLMQLTQKGNDPKAMASAKEAAHAAAQAKAAMDKGKKAESPERAKELGKEAGLQLEMAAKKAEDAAQAMPGPAKNDDAGKMGQALEKAQEKVQEANEQIKNQKPAKASPAMNQAAQALQKAAKQAGDQMARAKRKPGPPGKQSNPFGVGDPSGSNTSIVLGDLGKFNGKSWGELPGEVRNRIVQDLRTRYGDDFAGMVHRYFEQIADVPLNGRP